MLEKVSSFSGRCCVDGSIGFQVKSCFCVVTSCIGPLPSICLSQGVIGISGLTHQLPRKLNCEYVNTDVLYERKGKEGRGKKQRRQRSFRRRSYLKAIQREMIDDRHFSLVVGTLNGSDRSPD
jgi:hypothetical protein